MIQIKFLTIHNTILLWRLLKIYFLSHNDPYSTKKWFLYIACEFHKSKYFKPKLYFLILLFRIPRMKLLQNRNKTPVVKHMFMLPCKIENISENNDITKVPWSDCLNRGIVFFLLLVFNQKGIWMKLLHRVFSVIVNSLA